MTGEKEEVESIKLDLKVKESKILGEGGIARINKKYLDETDIKPGDRVEICLPGMEGKGIIVDVSVDKYVGGGMIVLRKNDMVKLGVEEYDSVVLCTYKNISDEMLDGVKKGLEGVKEGAKKLAEKVKSKSEEEKSE